MTASTVATIQQETPSGVGEILSWCIMQWTHNQDIVPQTQKSRDTCFIFIPWFNKGWQTDHHWLERCPLRFSQQVLAVLSTLIHHGNIGKTKLQTEASTQESCAVCIEEQADASEHAKNDVYAHDPWSNNKNRKLASTSSPDTVVDKHLI